MAVIALDEELVVDGVRYKQSGDFYDKRDPCKNCAFYNTECSYYNYIDDVSEVTDSIIDSCEKHKTIWLKVDDKTNKGNDMKIYGVDEVVEFNGSKYKQKYDCSNFGCDCCVFLDEFNDCKHKSNQHIQTSQAMTDTCHKHDTIWLKVDEVSTSSQADQQKPESIKKQVGGTHYSSLGIQPVEYIHKNNLDYFEGNVIKYVTRHKQKNKAEDIKKAMQYLEMILEMQYGVTK